MTSSNDIVNIKQYLTVIDSSVGVWWVKTGLIVVDVIVAVREGDGDRVRGRRFIGCVDA